MYFYRQIMSAVDYCHSFNICHRDLKPENILLTSTNQIKIADFGMAAIHQSPRHRLETACGSPHYAAPELLKNQSYRGDKADIWSLGVILFAMLSACLPFDDKNMAVQMDKIKKGRYKIPDYFSAEASDFIRRVLNVNPETRIPMKSMWKHALVRKYDYVDNLSDNGGQPAGVRKRQLLDAFRPTDVDPHILRQLRSMWHKYTEKELRAVLLNDE